MQLLKSNMHANHFAFVSPFHVLCSKHCVQSTLGSFGAFLKGSTHRLEFDKSCRKDRGFLDNLVENLKGPCKFQLVTSEKEVLKHVIPQFF